MTNEQHIENLKKLKSFHNGSYGASIDVAIKLLEQKPKTGQWINKGFRKEEYVLTGTCSSCGRVRVIDKFCPNCGAKMVEPQESEETE